MSAEPVPVPRLAPGVQPPEDREGEETVMLVPPDRLFRLPPLAGKLLRLIDGRRNLEEIARLLSEEAGTDVTLGDLQAVLDRSLVPQGVVSLGGAAAAGGPAQRRTALAVRTILILPVWVERLVRPFGFFFRPAVALAMVAGIAGAHAGLIMDGAVILAEPFLRWSVWLPAIFLAWAASLFHELGHAAALRHFGQPPGEVGVGLHHKHLVFYAEVSRAWLLPRRQRVVVDLGGAYGQALYAAMLWPLAHWWGPAPVLAAAILTLAQLRNLSPRHRSDGEWLLRDLAGPRGRGIFLALLLAGALGWSAVLAFGLGPLLVREGLRVAAELPGRADSSGWLSWPVFEGAASLLAGTLLGVAAVTAALRAFSGVFRGDGRPPETPEAGLTP